MKKLKNFRIHTFQQKKDLFYETKLVKGAFDPDKRKDILIDSLTVPFYSSTGEIASAEELRRTLTHLNSIGNNKWLLTGLLGSNGKIINTSTQLSISVERNVFSFYSSSFVKEENFEDSWRDLIEQGRSFFYSLFGKKKLYGIFTPAGEKVKFSGDRF